MRLSLALIAATLVSASPVLVSTDARDRVPAPDNVRPPSGSRERGFVDIGNLGIFDSDSDRAHIEARAPDNVKPLWGGVRDLASVELCNSGVFEGDQCAHIEPLAPDGLSTSPQGDHAQLKARVPDPHFVEGPEQLFSRDPVILEPVSEPIFEESSEARGFEDNFIN